MKKLLFLMTVALLPLMAMADRIDSLETQLRDKPQIQEKVYIHTDNNCYFIGDTLWYKAYVLRSDNLHPTDYSKLLYVELISPDGIVVERQHVVIGDGSSTCGQFLLEDSLYSGFYELRAYTKWDLNFNVTEKEYSIFDAREFYSKSLAKDYYRNFEGLYSRVLPIYAKPKDEGDWGDRYMYRRPKTRILKEEINMGCSFYPEGGTLVEGVPSRIAFELTDNNGMNLDIEGTMADGTVLKPTHMGKGVFEYTPRHGADDKVTFNWNDKKYTFHLPRVQSEGVVIAYDPETKTATVNAKGVQMAAYSVSCRGRMVDFKRISGSQVKIENMGWPTGINDIIVYDSDANPLASRLVFVNNNDMGAHVDVAMEYNGAQVTGKTTINPFGKVNLAVNASSAEASALPKSVSVAVRDARTDEPAYDNGNIMTDMLLSGDLKGFVAYPGYYFEKDDAEHRNNLDLLMMVQGWRKYKRVAKLRYLPERGLTYEGQVLRLPSSVGMMELTDVNVGNTSTVADQMMAEADALSNNTVTTMTTEGEADDTGIDPDASTDETVEYAEVDYTVHSTKAIGKNVYVEAEVSKDGETAGAVTETDQYGRFKIALPPFYDKAVLRVTAYNKSDSLKKCLTSKLDKGTMDERSYPDFYVKRDMFFPIFTQPYSWYQTNSPDILFVDDEDDGNDGIVPENSKLAGDHRLQTVVVKAKRRGRRAIDFAKPAYVRDIYDVYNDVTDYGLSFGVLDFNNFPRQVGTLLYGNMGRPVRFNIRAMVEGTTFYRNYTPMESEFDKNASSAHIYEMLRLNRMLNIRAYTDYESRTDSGDVVTQNVADVTLVFEPVPNDGKRYTYRDRRYIFDGITYAEEFYNRKYTDAVPQDPKDYRRTLYWNPNAKLDENGRFTDVLFNNSKETRLKVSAAGVSADGKLWY